MPIATGRVSGKGGANATCDICGQVYKNWMLRKNWRNLMVCPADFEHRHPMDFFRTIPDLFPLPFVRIDPTEISYTPTAVNITTSAPDPDSTVILRGNYIHDLVLAQYNVRIQYDMVNNTTVTIAGAATLSLPTTVGSAGTARILGGLDGKLLGTATIAGGATTVSIPQVTITCPKGLHTAINVIAQYGA